MHTCRPRVDASRAYDACLCTPCATPCTRKTAHVCEALRQGSLVGRLLCASRRLALGRRCVSVSAPSQRVSLSAACSVLAVAWLGAVRGPLASSGAFRACLAGARPRATSRGRTTWTPSYAMLSRQVQEGCSSPRAPMLPKSRHQRNAAGHPTAVAVRSALRTVAARSSARTPARSGHSVCSQVCGTAWRENGAPCPLNTRHRRGCTCKGQSKSQLEARTTTPGRSEGMSWFRKHPRTRTRARQQQRRRWRLRR